MTVTRAQLYLKVYDVHPHPAILEIEARVWAAAYAAHWARADSVPGGDAHRFAVSCAEDAVKAFWDGPTGGGE